MGKRYYWLKLYDNFFQQKPIKKLRKIAGGDTYTIIYLKMLLTAMKQDGKLYFEGVENTFFEELALDLDENPEDVEVTVAYLLNQGLMTLEDECEYKLEECAKMTGSETDSAERVRRYREKKALQSNIDVTDELRLSNGEKEIDIDNSITHYVRNTICPEQEYSGPEPVITILLNTGEEYPFFQKDIDEFAELYPALDIMQTMRNIKGWCINNPKNRKTKKGVRRFVNAWMARDQDKAKKPQPTAKPNSFNNFSQRDQDYEAIQAALLKKSMNGEQ
ncbi:MAG: phage replisome organizer N-terminal domain-containing protein [Bacteroidales bacterium]|nr:phage replisome organizer N-terminal domain-containing protein [Bacteroidales bacterium]